MFEIIKSKPMSFDEVHKRWPKKAAVLFDTINQPYLFSEVRVYAIGDNTDECLHTIDSFKSEFPDKRCMITHTSPTDDYGRPVYKD